jgi:hypothetical protein
MMFNGKEEKRRAAQVRYEKVRPVFRIVIDGLHCGYGETVLATTVAVAVKSWELHG